MNVYVYLYINNLCIFEFNFVIHSAFPFSKLKKNQQPGNFFSNMEINYCRFIGTLDIGLFYLVLFIAYYCMPR